MPRDRTAAAAQAKIATREALTSCGYAFDEPSIHQFKIGEVNFWPGTGKICVDGKRPHATQGLAALLALLIRIG